MVRPAPRLAALVFLATSAAAARAAGPPAPPPSPSPASALPFRAGFEEARPPALPAGWAPEGTPAGRVVIDREAKRTGAASLHVSHAAPGSTAVTGPALRLEVGKVYRLAGWVRTKAAVSDHRRVALRRFLRRIHDRRQLRHAHSGDDPGGAD